ncbi:MAG: hypothetical protein DRJ43_01105 [Thermoprotei archaeon]|nr:MAG: hypothetical protein DRJ43_01105 [Thermoprotei archaeon]
MSKGKMKTACLITGSVLLAAALIIPGYAKIELETCVGAWLLDEGSGEVARDYSGNGNDGKLVNGPKWVKGKFGWALSFDGVDDYVILPPITSTNWEGLTLVAWVWLEQLPKELPSSWDEILGSNQDLYDMYLDRRWNELRVKVTTTLGAQRPGIPAAMLRKHQWIHVAGIYDGQAVKIYMNGKLVDTHNLQGVINGVQYSSIGAQGGPNGPFTDFHKGLIDEVALFKTALSEDDLQVIMNEGLGVALGITPVSPLGKLASTWAALKKR